MLKVILIDDDQTALTILKNMLVFYPDIVVAGSYTEPEKGLKQILALKPDVAFVDISMPGMSGLDLALKLQKKGSGTKVVFITTHEDYAVQAFAVEAYDYLVKPMTSDRLAQTIKRLTGKNKKRLMVNTFNHFSINWEGQESIHLGRKRNKEVLAFLFHSLDRKKNKEEIVDILWPEEDPDRAIRFLYNAVYYLKKVFNEHRITEEYLVINKDYSLEIAAEDLVLVDRHVFLEADKDFTAGTDINQLEAKLDVYKGNYLEQEGYLWANQEKQRLLNIYIKNIIFCTSELIRKKDYKRAEARLLEALICDPYSESLTLELLNLYYISGEPNKALSHYRQYLKDISEELGIEKASNDIEDLLKKITEKYGLN